MYYSDRNGNRGNRESHYRMLGELEAHIIDSKVVENKYAESVTKYLEKRINQDLSELGETVVSGGIFSPEEK